MRQQTNLSYPSKKKKTLLRLIRISFYDMHAHAKSIAQSIRKYYSKINAKVNKVKWKPASHLSKISSIVRAVFHRPAGAWNSQNFDNGEYLWPKGVNDVGIH